MQIKIHNNPFELWNFRTYSLCNLSVQKKWLEVNLFSYFSIKRITFTIIHKVSMINQPPVIGSEALWQANRICPAVYNDNWPIIVGDASTRFKVSNSIRIIPRKTQISDGAEFPYQRLFQSVTFKDQWKIQFWSDFWKWNHFGIANSFPF